MNQDVVWQLIRYTLLAVGGFFTAKGYFTTEQLTTAIGAAGVLFTFAWGVSIKWGTKTVPSHVGDRANVPTVSPITGAKQ